MGVTYKAFDTSLRIPVALKVINAASINSELARQRFVREARAAAALRHPNVASVFHLGIEGDTYFYAMEFVDGETIESLIRRHGPVDPLLAVKITIQVARALNAAAKLELVHRDIKPANLMILNQDEELVVKVIDFGLAKSCKTDGEDLATVSMGGFVGTPHFASPEQLEEKDLDVRSDIYSLGVTLWYMLAGRTPFGGSLAQVMSQHLSKLPPFEQLQLPVPVVSLLKRMLAKEAGERFQTPTELRREAEKCAESLKGSDTVAGLTGTAVVSNQGLSGGAALDPTFDSDNFPTIASDPPAGEESFKIGTLVAGRYEPIKKLDDSTYVARIDGTQAQVHLMVLRKDLAGETVARIQNEAVQAANLQHPNLLRCYGLEESDHQKFLAIEAVSGCSLLDLLRARRQLTAREVGSLIDQAAEGIDFATHSGLHDVDLSLPAVSLNLADPVPETLLRQPLEKWPEFTLKFNPMGLARECLQSEPWAGDQTMVRRSSAAGKAGSPSPGSSIKALGIMVYELLGGNPQQIPTGGSSSRYVPLATLSEKGNAALKQALDPGSSYNSAKDFLVSFKREIALDRIDNQRAKSLPENVNALAEAQSKAGSLQQSRVETAREKSGSKAWLVGGACAILAGIVLAVVLTRSHPAQPRVTKTVQEVKEAGPVQPTVPSPTPQPPQVAAIQEAIPAPTPFVQPTPTRQDLLKERLNSVEKFEAAQDWARCLHEYVQIGKEFPESDAARVRLELVVAKMGPQIDKATEAEFAEIREDLTSAARLDVVSAMMLLGNTLKKREPAVAFSWFQSAAAKGHGPAMTQAGLMYSNGLGVGQPDLNKAFSMFEQAAEKGEAVAKTCLGECFLYGLGTSKNEKKAVETLREAADANEPRGMNLLGTCYQKGLGTAPDFNEALRLFKKAAEAGFPDALGNQGVLYMNGQGVKLDQRQAAELFEKGAALGSNYSMLLLATCYEEGIGVGKNQLQAMDWYKKSALRGNPRAVDWCKKNKVEISKD